MIIFALRVFLFGYIGDMYIFVGPSTVKGVKTILFLLRRNSFVSN